MCTLWSVSQQLPQAPTLHRLLILVDELYFIMTGLEDNRTLRILDAAAKGGYGVLAAIA
jgi:hypothetical protein